VTRLGPGAGFDPYADYDGSVGDRLGERSAILLSLADRLVAKNDTTDTFAKTGRRDDQFALGAPDLLGPRDPQCGKPSVAVRRALTHRQQAIVIGPY
jgi:hypothetical protein